MSVPKVEQRSANIRKTIVNKLSPYLQSPAIRWTLTVIWTAIAVSLMLSPSGDGTTMSWVSQLFGGTETTDAVGHIFINAIGTFLWCWTISLYATVAKTTRIVLIGGTVWCFGAELSQFFVPNRGAFLLDVAANIVGLLSGLMIFRGWLAFSTKRHQAS